MAAAKYNGPTGEPTLTLIELMQIKHIGITEYTTKLSMTVRFVSVFASQKSNSAAEAAIKAVKPTE